jgi:hypothetical protein
MNLLASDHFPHLYHETTVSFPELSLNKAFYRYNSIRLVVIAKI